MDDLVVYSGCSWNQLPGSETGTIDEANIPIRGCFVQGFVRQSSLTQHKHPRMGFLYLKTSTNPDSIVGLADYSCKLVPPGTEWLRKSFYDRPYALRKCRIPQSAGKLRPGPTARPLAQVRHRHRAGNCSPSRNLQIFCWFLIHIRVNDILFRLAGNPSYTPHNNSRVPVEIESQE